MATVAGKRTMGSIFVDMLSASGDETTKNAAMHVDDIIKSDVCARLFDVLVINALGYRCPINESTIDDAVRYIIEQKYNEIDCASYDEESRAYEKQQWSDFYIIVGDGMKERFRKSGLLNER